MKASHELSAGATFLVYHRGRLQRVRDHQLVTVWMCNHAHRSRNAAVTCAQAERRRRERNQEVSGT